MLGACYAFSDSPDLNPVLAEFVAEWHALARVDIPLLAEIPAEPIPDEDELRYLLSSLASFNGHQALAQAIEALASDTAWVSDIIR
jgi:hypothetical protein